MGGKGPCNLSSKVLPVISTQQHLRTCHRFRSKHVKDHLDLNCGVATTKPVSWILSEHQIMGSHGRKACKYDKYSVSWLIQIPASDAMMLRLACAQMQVSKVWAFEM